MPTARGALGFTLLELLVAVTVTLLLAGMLLAIVQNTFGLWHRVQGDFSSAAQARVVFDLLERDLQSAVHRSDAGHWLAVEVQNSPATLRDNHGWLIDSPTGGCIKPSTSLSLNAVPVANAAGPGAGLAGARFGVGGTWLRLFFLDNTGVPAAVSYQLGRRPVAGEVNLTNPAAPHYLLLRTTATDTLSRGFDVSTGYDDVFTAPGTADVLADNVVDFGVWLYVRDASAADGLQRIFPATATDTARYAALGNGSAAQGNCCPDVADVMVRIVSEEGAILLANLESGRMRAQTASDTEWWNLVEAHSAVFVHRVEVKGAGQ